MHSLIRAAALCSCAAFCGCITGTARPADSGSAQDSIATAEQVVADGSPDRPVDAPVDAPPKTDVQMNDAPSLDIIFPELPVEPDAHPAVDSEPGCPIGQIPCPPQPGCIDTWTDFQHCGGCNNPCDSQTADTCSTGSCVCGLGPKCSGGLTCVGGSCKCLPGGCSGCCSGDSVCVSLGSQNAWSCGNGGDPCVLCPDPAICNVAICSGGVCDVDKTALNDEFCPMGGCMSGGGICQDGNCACLTYDSCSNKPDGTPCSVGSCCVGTCCLAPFQCCDPGTPAAQCMSMCM